MSGLSSPIAATSTRRNGSTASSSTSKKLLDAAVEDIEATDLLDALLAIRSEVPETARRIAQRVGLVLSDAKLRKLIADNPHADIGHALRETKRDYQKVKTNLAALPFSELPGFVKKPRASEGIGAMAREFMIRRASRTSDRLGATWKEVDVEKSIWTIPPGRMKANEQHVVFMSKRAVELLKELRKLETPYCFPSPINDSRPLSNMAMLNVLRRLRVSGRATTHGFWSSFSTWAYEIAQCSRPDIARQDVIGASLTHQ